MFFLFNELPVENPQGKSTGWEPIKPISNSFRIARLLFFWLPHPVERRCCLVYNGIHVLIKSDQLTTPGASVDLINETIIDSYFFCIRSIRMIRSHWRDFFPSIRSTSRSCFAALRGSAISYQGSGRLGISQPFQIEINELQTCTERNLHWCFSSPSALPGFIF